MSYIRRRFAERTTWAGLSTACAAGLGALASVSGVSPIIINSLAGGVAVCGLLAALCPSPPTRDRPDAE